MGTKKSFKVYYLLVTEGHTEFVIFSYLTLSRFRKLFEQSRIKFSNKAEIVEAGISQGKLNGISSFAGFKKKYDLIKGKYLNQRLFFILDKDLNDSSKIENYIKANGDFVQFIEYNSEYLLLRFAGKRPKMPRDFSNLRDFRSYSKKEFQRQFGKKASELKEVDLNLIFDMTTDQEIKNSFSEIFYTTSMT